MYLAQHKMCSSNHCSNWHLCWQAQKKGQEWLGIETDVLSYSQLQPLWLNAAIYYAAVCFLNSTNALANSMGKYHMHLIFFFPPFLLCFPTDSLLTVLNLGERKWKWGAKESTTWTLRKFSYCWQAVFYTVEY